MGLLKKHWLGSKVIFFKEKQHFKSHNDIKYLLEIDCVAQLGFILGPLLNLIYLNDFCLPSELENMMFADDTNLFISEGNIGALF